MEIFSPELIKMNYFALDKKSCLSEMAEFLFEHSIVSSFEEFFKTILERENLMSTGIGRGIAIPHSRSETVKKLTIAVYLLDNELDFQSIDDEPVRMVFMIAVPKDMKQEYMKLLSAISNFLKLEENRDKLLGCKSNLEVYNILKGIKL
ncbi:MAG TPA: PTS sugar transporter subunit IIA [Candidatus Cloacimonetes bacterium]|nr:PTS sugar transporter subunit IIA [Candidatus Cloacimonadota bacterium]